MHNPYEAPQTRQNESNVTRNSLLKSSAAWLAVPTICLLLGIIATSQVWINIFFNVGIATSIVCFIRALVKQSNAMLTLAIILLGLNGILRLMVDAILNLG